MEASNHLLICQLFSRRTDRVYLVQGGFIELAVGSGSILFGAALPGQTPFDLLLKIAHLIRPI